MNRKLMCYGPFCHPKKIKHDRYKMQLRGKKHYCQKCFDYLNEQDANRRKLRTYIKDHAHVTHPNGIMLRDIGKLRNKYHYTYRGIEEALKYADKFSLKFSFDSSFFLRYVPFVYEKAEKYRYKRDRHDNLMLNINSIDNEIEHATVKHKVFEPKKNIPHYDMNEF